MDMMPRRNIFFCILVFLILLVSGCAGQNTKENAEVVAQKYAIELDKSNYDGVYDLFTLDLKSKISKDNFARDMIKKRQTGQYFFLVFDKVVMQGKNEAYAYYTFSAGLLDAKMPPIHMIFTSEGWRIDELPYFMDDIETNTMAEKCNEISNSPELKYPCNCVPTQRQNDNNTIDSESDPMCTCECDIGEGKKWVTDIRVSR